MASEFDKKQPIAWMTVKGVHIPIFEGETSNEALERVKSSYKQKMNKGDYISFGKDEDEAYEEAYDFFHQLDASSHDEWIEDLTNDERSEILLYTEEDGSYTYINKDLYKKGYDGLDESTRKQVDTLDSMIDKFELYSPIQCTRLSDLRMLGLDKGQMPSDADPKAFKQQIKNKLQETYGYIEYPSYLSSSADDIGRPVEHSNLMVHIGVPAGQGSGAYLGDENLNPDMAEENEYLFARNSVLKYDINSLKQDSYGRWVIWAEWVGKADD